LDGDPFTCLEDDLPTLRIARTIVGGVTVYRAD